MPIPQPDQRVARLERQLEAVQRISQLLFQSKSMNELVETMLKIALEVSRAEAGSLLLADAQGQHLVYQYTIGDGVAVGTVLPVDKGIAGAVFRSGKAEVLQDINNDQRHVTGIVAIDSYKARGFIAAPVNRPNGQPIGVLEIWNKRDSCADGDDLQTVSVIADYVAMAIEHDRISKDLKEIPWLIGGMRMDIRNILTPVLVRLEMIEHDFDKLFARLPDFARGQAQEAYDRHVEFLGTVRRAARLISDRLKEIDDAVRMASCRS